MEPARNRNVLLTGVKFMVPTYQKWGFQLSLTHQDIFSDGFPKVPEHFQPMPDIEIQPITDKNFNDIIEFDQSIWPISRSLVFRVFFNSAGVLVVKGAYMNGKLVGFITVRKAEEGKARVSGFYANSKDIAQTMLHDVIQNDIPAGTHLRAGYSKVNLQPCKELYADFGLLGLNCGDESMYTDKELDIKWENVFAIFESYAFPV